MLINGKKIRSLRIAKGWRQEDLAGEAGVSVDTIRKLESSSNLRPYSLRHANAVKIAKALNKTGDKTHDKNLDQSLDQIKALPIDLEEAARRAIKAAFLRAIETVNEDGAWGPLSSEKTTPVATATMITVIAAVEPDRPIIKKSLRWLEECQFDGGWGTGSPKNVDYESNCFCTAEVLWCLLSLKALGVTESLFDRSAKRATKWLIDNQKANGLWGPRKGRKSTIHDTIGALHVLHDIGQIEKLKVHPIKWCLDLQKPDGSWICEHVSRKNRLKMKDPHITDHFTSVVAAYSKMNHLKKQADLISASKRGQQWLRRNISKNMWLLGIPGEYQYNAAVLATLASLDDKACSKDWFRNAALRLMTLQQPTGAWPSSIRNSSPPDHVWTALSVRFCKMAISKGWLKGEVPPLPRIVFKRRIQQKLECPCCPEHKQTADTNSDAEIGHYIEFPFVVFERAEPCGNCEKINDMEYGRLKIAGDEEVDNDDPLFKQIDDVIASLASIGLNQIKLQKPKWDKSFYLISHKSVAVIGTKLKRLDAKQIDSFKEKRTKALVDHKVVIIVPHSSPYYAPANKIVKTFIRMNSTIVLLKYSKELPGLLALL